jgi:predicted ester cyclase
VYLHPARVNEVRETMPESNKDLVRRIADEVVNGGKLALADMLFAQGYVYHGPGGLEVLGPEGFRQMIGMFRKAFPDFQVVIEDMVAEGDRVAFRLTSRGTHKGDLAGLAPTGKSVIVTHNVISRFYDGKCVEEWQTFDEVGMLRQLGVVTLPILAHS